MSSATSASTHFIGWDVGGWNCDKNSKSRDAIVILDNRRAIIGRPWRGNLRECIGQASTTDGWLKALFCKCAAQCPAGPLAVTMAIDTPLGFPEALVGLITQRGRVEPDATSGLNRYLFRHTERHLFAQGLNPLSAIKDMIGSQATKGMHVVAKFAPLAKSCGVWSDGGRLTVIEGYPAPCRGSATMRALRQTYPPLGHDDMEDALTCALTAFLYSTQPGSLAPPPSDCPASEGWIWLPRDTALER